ncbi:MAG: selenocysteine-specific translation elongation factor [Tissierellia bacterium]|nr:selenocysteine-specific translation elongation factor [Tissierellia bacterium]
MKHLIIGTAGHIDHGKSTLIKALTGRETDRLQEEKDRGISINLGFTYFDLDDGTRAGIIDVPGHERFIKNMLSGAAGIDIVLFVIAADEGVMPQTMEHLDILEYMQIKEGIIVLTKCDKVDDEMIDLAEMDVRDQLEGSFLENAPLIPVDSVTKRGLGDLKKTILEISQKVEERDVDAPLRLNIDRVFTLKGHGTIITGTLMEGQLANGDELVIYPGEKSAKIRNIQVHDQDVDRAYAGQRTAINISNLKKDEIHRGDVLAAPYSLEESHMIDVRFKMSKHAWKPLEHWDRLRLFHGSREIFCRAVPLDNEVLEPGEEGFVQLRLEEPIYCKKEDIFVARTYSPMKTIGGGVIIDTSSKKHNLHNEEVLELLKMKEKGELSEIIGAYILQHNEFYPDLNEILSYTGESKEEVQRALEELENKGILIPLRDRFIHKDYLKTLEEKIKMKLQEYHKEHPLRHGLPKEEVKHQFAKGLSTKEFNGLLDVVKEVFQSGRNYIALADFQPILSKEDEKIKEKILHQIANGKYQLLTKDELITNGQEKDVFEYLLGEELFLLDDHIISKALYEQAKEKTKTFILENGMITLGEFRDLLDSSRKNALLLLDAFDRENFTKREGEGRVLTRS